MVSVLDLAAYILRREGPMTTFKLQKLLYYCQAWHLAWDGEALFSEPLKAWPNGPAVADVHRHIRRYRSIREFEWGEPERVPESRRPTIDAVLAFYGPRSASALVELTHREPPWRDARAGVDPNFSGGKVIPLESMKAYYGHLASDRTTRAPIDEWQERLRANFQQRLAELADALPATVLRNVSVLADEIVTHSVPTPSSVSIAPCEGRALVSLYGKRDREADVWVDESEKMKVVFSEPSGDDSRETERVLPIRQFRDVAAWLSGDRSVLP
jgi:uncharacterized phage-associated protein